MYLKVAITFAPEMAALLDIRISLSFTTALAALPGSAGTAVRKSYLARYTAGAPNTAGFAPGTARISAVIRLPGKFCHSASVRKDTEKHTRYTENRILSFHGFIKEFISKFVEIDKWFNFQSSGEGF